PVGAPPFVPAYTEDAGEPGDAREAGDPVDTRSEAPAPPAAPPVPGTESQPVHAEVVPGPIGGTEAELTVTVPDREPVTSRLASALLLLVVAAGLAALVCALVPVGPHWLDGAGAVAVVTA